jgi:hypothetical protein
VLGFHVGRELPKRAVTVRANSGVDALDRAPQCGFGSSSLNIRALCSPLGPLPHLSLVCGVGFCTFGSRLRFLR